MKDDSIRFESFQEFVISGSGMKATRIYFAAGFERLRSRKKALFFVSNQGQLANAEVGSDGHITKQSVTQRPGNVYLQSWHNIYTGEMS